MYPKEKYMTWIKVNMYVILQIRQKYSYCVYVHVLLYVSNSSISEPCYYRKRIDHSHVRTYFRRRTHGTTIHHIFLLKSVFVEHVFIMQL